MKACKMISKGWLYHKVRAKDFDSKFPPIESIPILREFPMFFPKDLPDIPP